MESNGTRISQRAQKKVRNIFSVNALILGLPYSETIQIDEDFISDFNNTKCWSDDSTGEVLLKLEPIDLSASIGELNSPIVRIGF